VKKHVRLLGSGMLLAFLAWRLDWRQVAASFGHLNVALWLLAVAVYIAIQVVSSGRWRMLGRVQGYDGPLGAFVAYYFIGMFFNLVLPTSVGGDVVRVWYLANRDGTGPRQGRRMAALVCVLAERINGVLVLVALACVAALFSPTPLPAWISGSVAAIGCAAVGGVLALPLLDRLFKQYPHFGEQPRLLHLRRLLSGALAYRAHLGMVSAVTALSLVVQVGNIVVVWLIGEALGLAIPPWYYGVLVPLVTLLTLLPISVNGMGLREAGTALLLAPLSIGEADAVTLSFLTFAVYTAASLVGVGFYLFGHFPRYQVKANANGEFGMVNGEAAEQRSAA
jgi:glycosyltransferase 2 family protein